MDERAHKHTTLKMQSLQQVQDQLKFLISIVKCVIDSTGALNLQEVPGKLVVVGGGYIGSELGTAFANFGSEVTILEGAKDILGGFEKQMTQPVKGMKEKVLKSLLKLWLNQLKTDNGVKVTYEAKGEEKNNRS